MWYDNSSLKIGTPFGGGCQPAQLMIPKDWLVSPPPYTPCTQSSATAAPLLYCTAPFDPSDPLKPLHGSLEPHFALAQRTSHFSPIPLCAQVQRDFQLHSCIHGRGTAVMEWGTLSTTHPHAPGAAQQSGPWQWSRGWRWAWQREDMWRGGLSIRCQSVWLKIGGLAARAGAVAGAQKGGRAFEESGTEST